VHNLTQQPTTKTVAGAALVAYARDGYPPTADQQRRDRQQTAQSAYAVTAAGAWLAAHPDLPKLADGWRVCPHGRETVIEVHPDAARARCVEALAAWAAATGTNLEITPQRGDGTHFEVHVPVCDAVTIVVTTDQPWYPALLAELAEAGR